MILESIGLGACANLLPRIAEFHGVARRRLSMRR